MKITYKTYKIYFNKSSNIKDLIIKNFDIIKKQKSSYFILECSKRYAIKISHELKYIRVLAQFEKDYFLDDINTGYFEEVEKFIDKPYVFKMSEIRNFCFYKYFNNTKFDKFLKDSLFDRDVSKLEIIKGK